MTQCPENNEDDSTLDYKQTWEKRWKEICSNPDGSLNLDQVMRELHDYVFMLEEVPKVYCEVTGGLLSKPNYYADSVVSAFEDEVQKRIERHEKDNIKESAPDYAYTTLEEFEQIVGYKVNEVFRAGWSMARATNAMLGISNK